MPAHDSTAVLLEGDGIAAVCIARLLTDAGVACVREPNARPKLAAILLGEQTQHLLRELFPATERHPGNLFASFVQVRRRIVLWGSAPDSLDLPHSGIVAPEGELLHRLWQRVPSLQTLDRRPSLFSWRIHTSRAAVPQQPGSHFGNLQATFARVNLRTGITPDACWVESVPRGWLFLLALGEGAATLIAVGDTPTSLLSQSRLVALQIEGTVQPQASVPAHPRLAAVLADGQTLSCGSAAISFDPLCGEGAGNAVREAFLAAAVVRASLSGIPREPLARHYAGRLTRGLLRHLQVCLQFYATGGAGDFWQGQATSLRTGLEQLQHILGNEPSAQFRLVDRDLLPVQPVSA